MYESQNKFVSKFVEKVASLITLYFVVPGINIPKFRSIRWLDHIKLCCWKSKKKSTCLKWTYGHFGNDYIVASLITLYFVVPGINIPKIRSIW